MRPRRSSSLPHPASQGTVAFRRISLCAHPAPVRSAAGCGRAGCIPKQRMQNPPEPRIHCALRGIRFSMGAEGGPILYSITMHRADAIASGSGACAPVAGIRLRPSSLGTRVRAYASASSRRICAYASVSPRSHSSEQERYLSRISREPMNASTTSSTLMSISLGFMGIPVFSISA